MLKLLAAVATCAVACGGEARQTGEPAVPASSAVGWPDLGRGPERFIRINIGEDAFAECRRVSPKFPFDSAVAYAEDKEQLGAFAECLNTAGMKGRTILLVGRADAQGSDTYNEELGRKRAAAIRQILVESGITQDRIELSSEGAKGAVGDQPAYSPGYDRRVDVVVKGGSHGP